jgi:DNA-binding YbaB/EbfC family protein
MGLFGNLGNLTGMLKGARELQERMGALQAELAARRFTAEAGAGAVRATVDGQTNLVDIKIDPAAVSDLELLEDLVKGAVGAASNKAREAVRAELSKLTGGLNIPGLPEMLGPT